MEFIGELSTFRVEKVDKVQGGLTFFPAEMKQFTPGQLHFLWAFVGKVQLGSF